MADLDLAALPPDGVTFAMVEAGVVAFHAYTRECGWNPYPISDGQVRTIARVVVVALEEDDEGERCSMPSEPNVAPEICVDPECHHASRMHALGSHCQVKGCPCPHFVHGVAYAATDRLARADAVVEAAKAFVDSESPPVGHSPLAALFAALAAYEATEGAPCN